MYSSRTLAAPQVSFSIPEYHGQQQHDQIPLLPSLRHIFCSDHRSTPSRSLCPRHQSPNVADQRRFQVGRSPQCRYLAGHCPLPQCCFLRSLGEHRVWIPRLFLFWYGERCKENVRSLALCMRFWPMLSYSREHCEFEQERHNRTDVFKQ